jgi:hypothetical protein
VADELLYWLRYLLAVAFAAMFLLAAIPNFVIIVHYLRTGRGASRIPLVGGIFGSLAVLYLPRPWEAWWAPGPWARWWWVPLVLDPGCLPMVVHLVLWLTIRRLKRLVMRQA